MVAVWLPEPCRSRLSPTWGSWWGGGCQRRREQTPWKGWSRGRSAGADPLPSQRPSRQGPRPGAASAARSLAYVPPASAMSARGGVPHRRGWRTRAAWGDCSQKACDGAALRQPSGLSADEAVLFPRAWNGPEGWASFHLGCDGEDVGSGVTGEGGDDSTEAPSNFWGWRHRLYSSVKPPECLNDHLSHCKR